MTRKRDTRQAAFVFDDEPEAPIEPVPAGWQEVPQARFFSWSQHMQLLYCASRDENSAQSVDEGDFDWKQFYLDRAQRYRDMAQELS